MTDIKKALLPFAKSGESLREFPPTGLVRGANLFVAVKREGKGTGWSYRAIHATVSDLHAAELALTVASEIPDPRLIKDLKYAAECGSYEIAELLGRAIAAIEDKAPKTNQPRVIELTAHEIQSGYDRVRYAEGLIRQLPEDHDGRNTWLLNYGSKLVAKGEETK